ncbi:MAG: SDR family oxidoreductase [Brevinematales bacterium]|nr:SDR family oxidoreductase [Brevinematales bacterium]
MELGIKGKKALVTASSKGIGKGIAKALGLEGAKVIISSSNKNNLIAAEREFRDIGIDVTSVVCDLSKSSDVENLYKSVGEVDIFVFNTGGPKPGDFFDVSCEDWYYAFELILMSAVRLTRYFLPKMLDKGWGRIVYMTSMAVKEPIEGLMLSNVFRSGLNAFSKSLSRTIKKDNITFNVICTGNIYTDRAIKLIENRSKKQNKSFEEVKKEIESSIPLGRFGSVEEISEFVVFLCSEKASYINGASIQVDGGFIRGVF